MRIGSSITTRSGKLKSLLTNVTDVVSNDAFHRISAGRSAFRVDDLLELRRLFDRRNRAGKEAQEAVRRILPHDDKRTLPHQPRGGSLTANKGCSPSGRWMSPVFADAENKHNTKVFYALT